MENPNYKNKNTEKIFKHYGKEPISNGEKQSFRIKKRFYSIERYRIERLLYLQLIWIGLIKKKKKKRERKK